MKTQSKGIGRSTKKITRTLLHQEDSDFKINDRQKNISLRKKKDSYECLLLEDIQLLGIKLSFFVYVMHVIILDIKM
jgi:hypothetical protein